MEQVLSRNVPIETDKATLLFIDVQNYSTHRNGSEYKGLSEAEFNQKFGYFFDTIENETIPNMVKIQQACRDKSVEVMYTVICNLTKDGRDRSLDYKITGFNVPKGSWDGEVFDAIKPLEDEIVLPKSSSSVFVSTNIDYVLRNLGTRYLIVCGFLTDQCVESAIRDACDLGYLVTMVTDACATQSQERHDKSVSCIKGYCRQITTDDFLKELSGL
ncbi:isochorismatase family cysteine hydrolase [Celerinatantimonas sp. MCCC 1A17872]|uniref:isochorismatase family cysteine hydrolase n=1 Tax=Celerinatantimonas sp. MCCC 1A17872 TaxID=3177514 RepID=UPI0038C920FE